MLSLDTMELLRELLGGASISVEAPDFETTSKRLATAKRELDNNIEKLRPKKPQSSATKKRRKKA